MTATHAFIQSAPALPTRTSTSFSSRSYIASRPIHHRLPVAAPRPAQLAPSMKLHRRLPLHRLPNYPAAATHHATHAAVPAATVTGPASALSDTAFQHTLPASACITPTNSALAVAAQASSTKQPMLSTLAAALLRPARTTLAFAARAAKRVRAARMRHRKPLAVLSMAATVSLALVSFFVTRTALTPVVATVGAPSLPALPALPFKLPPAVAEVVKPFTESFGVVFLSEFGDKSMFATALMAMKHSPLIVCVGALAALTVMTFIACFLGQLMHYLPATVTHYSSIALFVFFGLQMIMQSRSLPDTPGGSGGERADAEEMVAEASVAQVQNPMSVLAKVSSLIFVAEWCDRSMLATMALAASSNTAAVIGGATLANVVCTGMAVGGAALVASRISERLVALVAGILFEVFAVFTYLEGPEG